MIKYILDKYKQKRHDRKLRKMIHIAIEELRYTIKNGTLNEYLNKILDERKK